MSFDYDIHYNMNISCLIVHAQKFEDVRAKIEMPKKATSFDGGS